jgi:hypothetical protein
VAHGSLCVHNRPSISFKSPATVPSTQTPAVPTSLDYFFPLSFHVSCKLHPLGLTGRLTGWGFAAGRMVPLSAQEDLLLLIGHLLSCGLQTFGEFSLPTRILFPTKMGERPKKSASSFISPNDQLQARPMY